MALIGNYSVLNKSAGRWISGGTSAGTNQAQCRSNWNRPSDWKKFGLQDQAGGTGDVLLYAAKPNGYYPDGAWGLPVKAGGLSSHSQATGSSTVTLTLDDGRALSGLIACTSSTSATGALVSSGDGSATGTCTVTGLITAALNGVASSSGTCAITGAVDAVGNMTASAAGSCSATAVRYATGALVGIVTPFTDLSPQSLADAVLDTDDAIEPGLTMRQALRLISAAMAGKVDGAETSTITFRSAVSDGKERIIAEVDSNGNRTAITYDLDDE